ncbi:hypothetical protein LQ327_03015 [Actinomycetospora endophytica]|uniref:Gas vesicle protein GvpL/GvpF n=1 Tax=Actinomycetospora endophytica TaxID=2291215 RepID=A0ABS8P2A7_9PSEU|nr:hypothetical protein [Actinomycetospora endophytica]MCD2192368.1 hypothetical protein [Actinomycetospora endophytica]
MSGSADARRAAPPGTAPDGGAPRDTAGPGPTTPLTGIPAPSSSPETSTGIPAGGIPAPRSSGGRSRRRRTGPGPDGPTPIPPVSGRGGGLPPYSLGRRLTDWRRGRADGRAGLPGIEPGRPPGTPTLEEFAQDFLARTHRERLRLDVELTPLLEAEAALVVRIEETEAATVRSGERLGGWPLLLDDGQLGLRRGGESQTPDDVVRARRAREYEALRRPMVEDLDRLRRATATAHEDLARVRAAMRAREVVGATRVRRLHAQAMRRISAYERHLVRCHPAGDRVGPLLAAQHPRLPGWVFAAEEPGVVPGSTAPTRPSGSVPSPASTATRAGSAGPAEED